MMGIHAESLKAARRRKRTEKKRRRESARSNLQSGSTSSDMEEIHLKRRVLEPSSELLLTWWDETKNKQEGLLISCKCNNNNCTDSPSVMSAPVMSNAPNDIDGSVLVREKLNIRSPPYVSNMLDTSYSGVALYNEAKSLCSSSGMTIGTVSPSGTSRLATILPKPEVVDVAGARRDDSSNWRNKRPYPCDYCEKPFRTSYEKRRHEMIHTGNRPWQCTECNKSFVDRACLRNHMRKRHVGEKPYKCSFCDITFFNTASRAKHERTHEERMRAARAEMALKRELAAGVSGEPVDEGGSPLGSNGSGEVELEHSAGDPSSSSIDAVGDRLRRQLGDTSEELVVVNGVEGGDPMLVKEEMDHHPPSETNGVEGDNHQAPDQSVMDMSDVFNITVIPDTVTIVETDHSGP